MNEFIITAVGIVLLVGCVVLILRYIDEPPPPPPSDELPP